MVDPSEHSVGRFCRLHVQEVNYNIPPEHIVLRRKGPEGEDVISL